MESHEVMKKTINHLGVKSIASDLNLSTSLIYKWCQSKDHPDAAGADNPLDRLERIFQLTGDTTPIEWLCSRARGFFVPNPPAEVAGDPLPLLMAAQQILSEFSGLLKVVSQSVADDQKVDRSEAEKIRAEWDKLKSVTEQFVVACESGLYGQQSESEKKKK
jgi:hypothetical protein